MQENGKTIHPALSQLITNNFGFVSSPQPVFREALFHEIYTHNKNLKIDQWTSPY
jgi:hypothetical protein